MYVVESSLSTQEPIMLINYPIGQDDSDPSESYIDGALFQKELLELDGSGFKRIQVWINCPGGNVYEGYNICNAILKSKTPVDTYVCGIAASMAGAIFMCGRNRTMTDYSCLMVHNPYDPNGSQTSRSKKQIEALKVSLIKMISAKCNLSEDAVSYLMDRETWIYPSECLEKGFCTQIEATREANQKRMPLVSARAMWKEATLIQNNIFNMNENQSQSRSVGISLIANYLELNSDASETNVLAEVKSRINRAVIAKSEAEDALGEMKKALDKAKAEYEELRKKYSDAVAKMESDEEDRKKAEEDRAEEDKKAQAKLKKEAEDAKIEALKVSAKAMVDSFAGKRIKNEEVAKWVDLAIKNGVDETKTLIEGLPLNQNAVSTKEDKTPSSVVIETSAMGLMAKVQANLRNKKSA